MSFNQGTTEGWTLRQAVDACVRASIPWIGVWRHKVAELGTAHARALIDDAGLRVSSLLRAGFFPYATEDERRVRRDDNRRAVEEAAELGAEVLVLVCGPAAGRDLPAARAMVDEGLAELVPYAREHGVKLGIEPLHPMMAAERSVVVTLGQANAMAKEHPPEDVGVIVDVYHVWWDPELDRQVRRAAGRVLGFHVSDWLVPTRDVLAGRGVMGDGVIDLRSIRGTVERAGYDGPIEVEILNLKLWEGDGADLLPHLARRYLEHV
jgi:sugar phosphate isomerase/epimerase